METNVPMEAGVDDARCLVLVGNKQTKKYCGSKSAIQAGQENKERFTHIKRFAFNIQRRNVFRQHWLCQLQT
jgi:hypothetical protein